MARAISGKKLISGKYCGKRKLQNENLLICLDLCKKTFCLLDPPPPLEYLMQTKIVLVVEFFSDK